MTASTGSGGGGGGGGDRYAALADLDSVFGGSNTPSGKFERFCAFFLVGDIDNTHFRPFTNRDMNYMDFG